jgi:hypothetical protein
MVAILKLLSAALLAATDLDGSVSQLKLSTLELESYNVSLSVLSLIYCTSDCNT